MIKTITLLVILLITNSLSAQVLVIPNESNSVKDNDLKKEADRLIQVATEINKSNSSKSNKWESIIYYDNLGDTSYFVSREFDAMDRITSYTTYEKHNGIWGSFIKHKYFYNNSGLLEIDSNFTRGILLAFTSLQVNKYFYDFSNRIDTLEINYCDVSYSAYQNYRLTNQYDNQNRLLREDFEHFDTLNMNWVKSSKHFLRYTSSGKIEVDSTETNGNSTYFEKFSYNNLDSLTFSSQESFSTSGINYKYKNEYSYPNPYTSIKNQYKFELGTYMNLGEESRFYNTSF